MMENVLVNFEDTGNSFLIVSNFEVLKGHWVHLQSMGHAHTHTIFFLLAFLSRKHTGNHLQQVSPFKLVGVHLLLKFCLVCISRLGVKIVESFQFEWRPRVTYVMAGCQVTSLWMVFSDQYLAFSTVNMSSCSSSKFPLVEIMMLGS